MAALGGARASSWSSASSHASILFTVASPSARPLARWEQELSAAAVAAAVAVWIVGGPAVPLQLLSGAAV